MVTYTVPGMKTDHAQDAIGLLQDRLNDGSPATGNARTEREAAERVSRH